MEESKKAKGMVQVGTDRSGSGRNSLALKGWRLEDGSGLPERLDDVKLCLSNKTEPSSLVLFQHIPLRQDRCIQSVHISDKH